MNTKDELVGQREFGRRLFLGTGSVLLFDQVMG